MQVYRALEEPTRSGRVTVGGQEEVYRLAELVDRPVQILPLTAYEHIGCWRRYRIEPHADNLMNHRNVDQIIDSAAISRVKPGAAATRRVAQTGAGANTPFAPLGRVVVRPPAQRPEKLAFGFRDRLVVDAGVALDRG